jgi:hypothetical protein
MCWANLAIHWRLLDDFGDRWAIIRATGKEGRRHA